MAERERLTKQQRREQARRERREREAAAARAARRRRLVTIASTVAVIAGVAAVFVLSREPAAEKNITVDQAAAVAAAQAAGCQGVDIPDLQSSPHLDEPAPPPTSLYPVRPTDSGPHFGDTAAVGAFDSYQDERRVVHNLEHGSVVGWYDPDKADGDALRDWVRARNRAGFRGDGPGVGLIAAGFPDGLSTGKAVALRAWGVALDCDRFDQTVADAFVIQNFGTHGRAPEGSFAAYPEDVLRFTEAPAPGPTGTTPATVSPTPTTSQPAVTTTSSPVATASP